MAQQQSPAARKAAAEARARRQKEAETRRRGGQASGAGTSTRRKEIGSKVMTFKELMARKKSKGALAKLPKSATAGQRQRGAGKGLTIPQLEKLLAQAKAKKKS